MGANRCRRKLPLRELREEGGKETGGDGGEPRGKVLHAGREAYQAPGKERGGKLGDVMGRKDITGDPREVHVRTTTSSEARGGSGCKEQVEKSSRTF